MARLPAQDFTLEITPGKSIIVTGANGAGKTSMFRVLAGLWNPICGRVLRPRTAVDDLASRAAASASDLSAASSSTPGAPQRRPSATAGARGATGAGVSVFYVPQRPYLVSGTLRDQVTYPQQLGPGDDAASVDRLVLECLGRVGLEKIALQSPRGLDTRPHDWADVLSGGEKQARSPSPALPARRELRRACRCTEGRICRPSPQRRQEGSDFTPDGPPAAAPLSLSARFVSCAPCPPRLQRVGLARLFFHRPAFAVLDEATSAINPEEEGRLYEQLNDLGITVFSIAHRHELARFHKMRLDFAADGTGAWTLAELGAGGGLKGPHELAAA